MNCAVVRRRIYGAAKLRRKLANASEGRIEYPSGSNAGELATK